MPPKAKPSKGNNNRRKPFSGKQKKQQLKLKKQKKRQENDQSDEDDYQTVSSEKIDSNTSQSQSSHDHTATLHNKSKDKLDKNENSLKGISTAFGQMHVSLGKSGDINTLSTMFVRESEEAVKARKAAAVVPIDATYRKRKHRAIPYVQRENGLRMPLSLYWKAVKDAKQDGLDERDIKEHEFSFTKQHEEAMFQEWLSDIYARYDRMELNQFEHNIEVWRQLWHVLDNSDILILIADIRNPLYHLDYSLYETVTMLMKKPMIVVLNKVDLVPDECVNAWIKYLGMKFPKLSAIVPFTANAAQVQNITRISQRRRAIREAYRQFNKEHMEPRISSVRRLCHALNVSDEITTALINNVTSMAIYKGGSRRSKHIKIRRAKQRTERAPLREKQLAQESNLSSHHTTMTEHLGTKSESQFAVLSDSSDVESDSDSSQNHETPDVASEEIQDKTSNGKKRSVRFSTTDQYIQETSKSEENEWTTDDDDDDSADSTVESIDDAFSENDSNEETTSSETENDSHDLYSKPTGILGQWRHMHSRTTMVVGALGHPNVGKSSVINVICGEKRVSVSRTPGHTKRVQTVPVADGLDLLDCPGLVFPHTIYDFEDEKISGSSTNNLSNRQHASKGGNGSSTSKVENVSSSDGLSPNNAGIISFSDGSSTSNFGTVSSSDGSSTSNVGIVSSSDSNKQPSNNVAINSHNTFTANGNRIVTPSNSNTTRPLDTVQLQSTELSIALQQCLGVVPLSQVREPFTAIRALAERLPLEQMYGLKFPDDWDSMVSAPSTWPRRIIELLMTPGKNYENPLEISNIDHTRSKVQGTTAKAIERAAQIENHTEHIYDTKEKKCILRWSAYTICDAFATKKNIRIAKTGQPDVHAAGRTLLYDAVDGIIPLYFWPPDSI